MIFTNKTYDALKWVALTLLPALSIFYLALSDSWNLPYPTQIAATIAAIDVFLAALLGLSSSNYRVLVATLGFNLSEKLGEVNDGWVLPKVPYDILTWVAQMLLPALATLYFALSGIWNLPYAPQVVATIMAIDTFLGMLLGFSTAQFHKQVALEKVGDHPAGLTRIY
jgi:hypothetical protein